ncbi:hypothetical protein MUK42_33803 [Musa troglodytarum]|uniref:Haem-binding uptake Tiki superfamily ChaN domain-containing protein n=1 Tax=Musa troglodytarum TaxID=320322 RepID=A0A9E7GJU4_9LILI|nr:hypothetical protein MUK42_33803 [Musa troglodytarum]
MIANSHHIADLKSSYLARCPAPRRPCGRFARQFSPAALRRDTAVGDGEGRAVLAANRREFLLLPSLAMAAGFLHSVAAAASATVTEEKAPEPLPSASARSVVDVEKGKDRKKEKEEGQPEILSRVYDATVIGEPQAVGKGKRRVWEKLMGARVVYLGESEMVPDRDDRVLELEIVKNLRNRCLEQQRTVSLALEAFPIDLQQQIDQFMDERIDGGSLRSYTCHWPPERWQEYEPLLNYCRDNGVKLIACGTPLKVLRTVQAEAQARVIDEYTMSQSIMKAINSGSSADMLIVVTGASHVIYGSRGTGVPARISKKLQKKNQVVILLDPERQQIRREGEVPVADFLWYSAAKPCSRNC